MQGGSTGGALGIPECITFMGRLSKIKVPRKPLSDADVDRIE